MHEFMSDAANLVLITEFQRQNGLEQQILRNKPACRAAELNRLLEFGEKQFKRRETSHKPCESDFNDHTN